MAKLKGIEKINNIINELTEEFGIHAELGEDFSALCAENKITYTLVCTDEAKQYFLADVEARYPEIKADIFLWCLLHELGHCMTDDMWSVAEDDYFWMQKDRCSEIEDDEARYAYYYAIPDEFFATKWAGDFMLENIEYLGEFWQRLQAAIIMCYIENGVEA